MSNKEVPLIGTAGVKYGLQIRQPPHAATKQRPTSVHPTAPLRKNVFGDDSDEEDVEAQVARQADKKKSAAKVAAIYESALAEDSSVFDYDGVYDSMQEKKIQPRQQEKLERKSRYIAQLKEQAEERKRENDIAFERKTIKDRVKEDHLWEDKEVFVTQAYKKKLEEQKLWQEEQRRKEEEEKRNDVRNIGHMAHFYSNLNKNVAFGHSGRQAELTAVSQPEASTSLPRVEAEGQGLNMDREGLMAAAKKVGIVDKYELLRLEAERAMRAQGSGGERRGERRGEQDEEQRVHDEGRATRLQGPEPSAAPIEPVAAQELNSASAAVKRRNDETSVQSAKERYLARSKKQHV